VVAIRLPPDLLAEARSLTDNFSRTMEELVEAWVKRERLKRRRQAPPTAGESAVRRLRRG
jgi:hypothetical protein